jgi:hypothetical protein
MNHSTPKQMQEEAALWSQASFPTVAVSRYKDAAAHIHELQSRQTCWLIERLKNSQTEYWTGRISKSGPVREGVWDYRASEGVRFSRQEDAAIVLSWLFDGAGRAAQHMFVDSPASGGAVDG